MNLVPQEVSLSGIEGANIGRMSIKKKFSGTLDATSVGEMLSAVNKEVGYAGYVAIEQVIGTLAGHPGSFIMQHLGTMYANNSSLTVQVLPGSGTGDLKNLSGQMQIRIEAGQHFYDFEYELG